MEEGNDREGEKGKGRRGVDWNGEGKRKGEEEKREERSVRRTAEVEGRRGREGGMREKRGENRKGAGN